MGSLGFVYPRGFVNGVLVMVRASTSFGKSGLQDWLFQRVTAVILAAYFGYLFFYCLQHPGFQYQEWRHLFQCAWMRYATILALVSVLVHAWIGLWTVSTDYLKPTWLRFTTQIFFILLLLGYLMWGIHIVWSV